MIVRNEAANLHRSLASVRSVADEIVVVDTGSSDESVEVARSFGARVAHFAWCDDFAAARNAALDLATGAWVLSLDADEELSPESHDRLREIVARDPEGPTLLSIAVECVEDGGQIERAMIARLVSRLPEVRWVRPIHETLANVAGGALHGADVPEIKLWHFGYLRAERARQSKSERNLGMLLDAIARWPQDVAYRYYLGMELFAQRRFAETIAAYEPWIEAIEACFPRTIAVRAWVRYVGAIEMAGRPEQAADLASAAAARLGTASLHAVAAEAMLAARRPREAVALAEDVDRIAIAGQSLGDEVMPAAQLRATADLIRAHAARQLGDRDGARRAYERAVAAGSAGARGCLAELSIEENDLVGAEQALRAILGDNPSDEPANILLSQIERRSGRLQDPIDRLVDLLAAAPTSTPLRLELAACLMDATENAVAADVLAAALETPQLAAAPPRFRGEYFDRLGTCLLEVGRVRDALDAFNAALQADPTRPGPRAVLHGLEDALAAAEEPRGLATSGAVGG